MHVTCKVYYITCCEDTEGEWRYSSTLFLTSALEGGGWLTQRPGRFTPGKVTSYPLCRRLCGPQGRCGRVRNISPRPGFDCPACSDSLYRLRYPGHVSRGAIATNSQPRRLMGCLVPDDLFLGKGSGTHCARDKEPQGRFRREWRRENLLLQLGFEPRTVQRYRLHRPGL